MRIRPFTDADAAGLAALRGADGWLLGSNLHGPDRAAPWWKRTVIAEHDDRLLGVATVGENLAHPSLYSAMIDVATGYRRQGIGRALLAALLDLIPERKPFLGKIWADDVGATRFVRVAGGMPIQRSSALTIHVRHPAVRDWMAAQNLPAQVALRTGTELSRAQLTTLWTDIYCWIHQGWAPNNTRTVMDTIFANITDTMDLAATRIAVRADRPTAAAFVIPAFDRQLVVAETATPDEPDGYQLVAGLLGHTLARLTGHQVMLDGHISDPHLWPVAATIPYRTGRELLVVQAPP